MAGAPEFRFSLGNAGQTQGVARVAAYDAGQSTATKLVFTYEVQASDEDTDGIWVGDHTQTFSPDANANIRITSNNAAAILTHAQLGLLTGHKVDGSGPPPPPEPPATTGTVTGTGQAPPRAAVQAGAAAVPAKTTTATRQRRRPSSPWTPPAPPPRRGRSTPPPMWITSAQTCPTPGQWSSRRVGRPPPWAPCGKPGQS